MRGVWKSQKNIAPERHPSHFCSKNWRKMLDLEFIPGSRGSRGSGPRTAARHLPNTRRGSGWRELKTNSLKLIGKLVSVSFRVRVVRACVRSCVSVRGTILLYAGGCDGEMSCSGASFGTDFTFAYLLLYTRVLRKIMPICYYTQGF